MRRTPASPSWRWMPVTERADLGARAGGVREQRQRGGRGARWPIRGRVGTAPGRLAAVLAEERAGREIQEADLHAVPLDGDVVADPARRGGIVGVVDLDAAVEMHGARAELIVAKRRDGQRRERGPLVGEHGGHLALGGAVNAGVGPARVPAVEIRLRLLQRLEAQALERGLRMRDGRLDLPLPIRIPDATRQGDGAVVREHVAIERVQRRIVDVRLQHALAQIVEDDDLDRPAQPAKRLLVQLGPAPRARREEQEPDALAAVAQREDEQPRAAVLARLGMPDHRPGAVVDLAFFAGGRHDDGVRVGGRLAAEREDEAADAGVLRGKAVIVDEVAPDRHGVAAARDGDLDQLAIRLARTGRRRASGWRRRARWAADPRGTGRRVGRHLYGRICRRVAPPPRRPHGEPGGLEVGAGRLAPHARRLLDAPERPAQSPQGPELPVVCRHSRCWSSRREGPQPHPPRQRLERLPSMAGFEVSTYGRFWVSTEAVTSSTPFTTPG